MQSLLGRGGMASAYRVLDETSGEILALKRMAVPADKGGRSGRLVELFEREYHTLTQLAHPRVVQARDFGTGADGLYYTMELLDGGDLRELSPLPWQEVCAIAYEVCSVLALLHSRRLVHRDLTPRNIRRTADGKAKLIDFGLLAPMGPAGIVAGTPPYVAPELINAMSLDGRSDLFSLGATMYYALCDVPAFPARRFDQLADFWRSKPLAPSRRVAGIPPAVDALVMGMLRIDPGSRPKSAAEVMDLLRPHLQTPPDEALTVVSAYLATPKLIGRDEIVQRMRGRTMRSLRRHGGSLLLLGEPGSGRSRMLDSFVLEAKLAGASSLRAGAADAARGPFGLAAALAAQLYASHPALCLEVARSMPDVYATLFGGGAAAQDASARGPSRPELVDLSLASADRIRLQSALRRWLLGFAARRPLAIAVDDMERVDEPSAALLAALSFEAPRSKLVLAVTLQSGQRLPSAVANAISVLEQHAARLELALLDEAQTHALLRSVFGEVPHLRSLSARLYGLCRGRPRECMGLAQHLVDSGIISYSAGAFALPEELPPGALPDSLTEALRSQVDGLSAAARRLGQLLALSVHERLSRAQLTGLPDLAPGELDRALDELCSARVVTGGPDGYALCDTELSGMLTAGAAEDTLALRHRELAIIYKARATPAIIVANHLLCGGCEQEGLDYLLEHCHDAAARTEATFAAAREIGGAKVGDILLRALDAAERHGHPLRQLQVLWVMLAGMSSRGEDVVYYERIPPAWCAQLKRDSGFDDYYSLDPGIDPLERLQIALTRASERYQSTPEAERVLPPIDAIKQLVAYVVFSIALGVRTLDVDKLASLPPLLEPFAPLSPIAQAMLDNARATCMNHCGQREQARELFQAVLERIHRLTESDLSIVESVRSAISQTLAEIDASLGLSSEWTEGIGRNEGDPLQQVGTHYIRKVAALHQGNWEAAERHRQRAELAALHNKERSMFSTLGQELEAHAMARDLTGLRQLRAPIAAMAERYPGWVPVMHVCEAHYLLLCGELEGALRWARQARPGEGDAELISPWAFAAAAVEADALLELGRADQALATATAALAQCERRGIRYLARNLACLVSLAEAQLARGDRAATRIEAVIAEQKELGVTGVQLGSSYEQRARVAIFEGDEDAFARFSELAAEQYRPGANSVLGALYERLVEQARSAGFGVSAAPHSVEGAASMLSSWTQVSTAMAGCEGQSDRARRALALLCEGDPPRCGFLFMLTGAGLRCAAFNAPAEPDEEVAGFAQAYIDLELRDSDCTMTAAEPTAVLGGSLLSGVWAADDGEHYQAILLKAMVSGAQRVTGIAILNRLDRGDDSIHRLANALAKNLIESGDFESAIAAA